MSDWFRQCDKPLATASFRLDCEISIPEGAVGGQALLLLEFPGKDHFPTNCSCQVNGRGVPLEESSSMAHISDTTGGPSGAWKRLQPYISHWTWYICRVEPGNASLRFSGMFLTTVAKQECGLGRAGTSLKMQYRSHSNAQNRQCRNITTS